MSGQRLRVNDAFSPAGVAGIPRAAKCYDPLRCCCPLCARAVSEDAQGDLQ